MMILILIITIIQRIPHITDISYWKQNKLLTTIKLERKRITACNNPFLFLTLSSPLTLSSFISPLLINKQQKYMYIYIKLYPNT